MSFKISAEKNFGCASDKTNKQTNIGGQDNGNSDIDCVPSRLKCFLDYSAFKGSPAVDLKRQFIPELQGKAAQCTARLLSSQQGERVVRASVGQRQALSPPDLSETASSLAPSTLFSSLHCIATLESKNGRQRPKIFRVTHS